MVKLTEAMGTKYLYETWRTPLTRFLREHAGETIDLAGARLTSGCISLIEGAIATQTHTFVDTEDSRRDGLMKYNAKQAELAKDATNKKAYLPVPRTAEEVKELLAKPYDTNIYYFLAEYNTEYNMLWAILLQASRPEVPLYTVTYARELFKTIQKYYHPVHYAGRDVFYLEGSAMCVEPKASVEFCTSHVCIPAEFGQANLFNDKNWEMPLRTMLTVFYSYLRRTGYHIKDFLQSGV